MWEETAKRQRAVSLIVTCLRISPGSAKMLEVSSLPHPADIVEVSLVRTQLKKARFWLPIWFRYGFHVLTFPKQEIIGGEIAVWKVRIPKPFPENL